MPTPPVEPINPPSTDTQPPAPPLPPTYPQNQAPLPVAHEGELNISRIVFAGIDPARVPDAVRITAIEATGMPTGMQGPLFRSTPKGDVALKPGDIIERADFDNIRWHAQDNHGGTFRFTPLSSSGEPIDTALTQSVGVKVHPEPPNYPSKLDDLQVAHDGSKSIAATIFSGLDPARQPAGIRITAINPRNPDDTEGSALVFGPQRQKVEANWFILAKDFDKLAWDSASNEGGSFRFEAANADGTTLLGAVPQRVQVIEHPAPPDYPDQPTSLWVAHDADLVLDESNFVGREAAHKPTAIRITQIVPAGGGADTDAALSVTKPGVTRPLRVGSVVNADEFAWITWHAAGNEGGRFSFEAINADGTRILGSDTHTLSIREQASLPVYQGPVTLNVDHDSRLWIVADVFRGSELDKAPPAIRILSVRPTGADPALGALRLQDGTVVGENRIIDAQQFGRLQWFAQVGQGGSFQFEPVHADGSPIPGSSPQTVHIHEAMLPPSYPDTAQMLSVDHDGVLALAASTFAGSDPSRQPAAIRVEVVNPHQPAPGSPGPLKVDRDGAGPLPLESVDPGTPLAAEHFDKLVWDASTNEGGSFRFVALDADGREIVGVNPQTITVQELPAPPDVPSVNDGEPTRVILRDKTVLLGREAFAGAEAALGKRIRIESIEADGFTKGSSSPLLWDKQKSGNIYDATRVDPGQVLELEDLDRLHWEGNASYRDGTIRYVLLDTAGEVQADAGEQVLHLDEQLRTARVHLGQVARHSLSEAKAVLNGHAKIPLAQFGADDPEAAPDHVRVRWTIYRDDNLPKPTKGSSPLLLYRGSGDPLPVEQDQVIHQRDLGNLFWNAAYNQGGYIDYDVLDIQKQRVLGISTQRISVQESSQLPNFSSLSNSDIQVPDGQTIRYAEGHLLGYDLNGFIANAIRIDAIHEIDDADRNLSALMLVPEGTKGQSGYKPRQDVSVGDVVDKEDIYRFGWDNSGNRGGHFTFTPLDSLHQPIPGLGARTYEVIEFGPVPAYQGSHSKFSASGYGFPSSVTHIQSFAHRQEIPFNKVTRLDRSLFAGTDPDREPHAVAVHENPSAQLNQDDSLPLLTIQRPNGEVVPIRANDRIASEDFDHVYWDSTRSTNGALAFVPIDSNGRYIHSSSDTVVMIQLSFPSGPIPLAQGTLAEPVVGHDTISRFDQDVFFNVLGRPSEADIRGGTKRYRILSYTEQTDDGRKLFPYYMLSEDGEPKAYELVTLDEAINKTEAARQARDKGGRLLLLGNEKNKTWLDEQFFKTQGTSLDQVLHDGSEGKAQSTAFVVQYDDYKPALFYFSSDQSDHRNVWQDSVYYASSLGNFAWRSENNQGGTITIAEVDPSDKTFISTGSKVMTVARILPDTTVTIEFTEAAATEGGASEKQGKQLMPAAANLPVEGTEAVQEADAASDSRAKEAGETTPTHVAEDEGASRETDTSGGQPGKPGEKAAVAAEEDQASPVLIPGSNGETLSLPALLSDSSADKNMDAPVSLMVKAPVPGLLDEPWPTVPPTL
ncbi:MAG: hypothetical protein Q4E06_05925 [Lautropia sp.]|nr:hypothetical protein [Lautropia sp.]